MTRDGYNKHKEVIEAWANGAEVEMRVEGMWHPAKAPKFSDNLEYRIKPKVKLIDTRLNGLQERLDKLEATLKGTQIDCGTENKTNTHNDLIKEIHYELCQRVRADAEDVHTKGINDGIRIALDIVNGHHKNYEVRENGWWVSMCDAAPDLYEKVLVRLSSGTILMGSFQQDGFHIMYSDGWDKEKSSNPIKYWHPIPEFKE